MTHPTQPRTLRRILGAALTALCAGLFATSSQATLVQWSEQVALGTPATYTATNIFTPSTANIGNLSGDITYEFIVNGEDRATAATLLGAIAGGAGQAIRFEQYNNTNHYGLTQYYVDDYMFSAQTAFDTDVYLAFVVNSALHRTTLYVNGVSAGYIPIALTLSGNVAFGGTLMPGGGYLGDDSFAGEILGFAAYDSALSAREIRTHSAAFFELPEPAPWLLLPIAGLAALAARRRPRALAVAAV